MTIVYKTNEFIHTRILQPHPSHIPTIGVFRHPSPYGAIISNSGTEKGTTPLPIDGKGREGIENELREKLDAIINNPNTSKADKDTFNYWKFRLDFYVSTLAAFCYR